MKRYGNKKSQGWMCVAWPTGLWEGTKGAEFSFGQAKFDNVSKASKLRCQVVSWILKSRPLGGQGGWITRSRD